MHRHLAATALALTATPALAHHPLGGAPMETFANGLLSGVGHPILGFDHLFFVALVGVAALFTGAKRMAPAAYVGAMLAGVGLMYAGVGLPLKEAVIALSLLVLGTVVLSGRALPFGPAAVVFAGFGLFHGSAFGDAIAGQEAATGGAVLLGYLIGLGAVQYLVALAAGWTAKRFLGATHAAAANARLVGAAVAGVGLFLTLEAVEGPALAAVFGI